MPAGRIDRTKFSNGPFVSNSFQLSTPTGNFMGESGLPGFHQAWKDWQFYQTYKNDTRKWREERDRLVNYTMGAQWSRNESDHLEDREQIDITLNMVRPLLRTTVSLQLAGKPQGVIYGQNVSSLEALLQRWVEWHWQKSNGSYLAEKVVMRQNREGVGFYQIFDDPTLDYGRGELSISHLSYNNVFVDRGAGREWDWSDAPRIIVSKLMRPEEFYKMNPQVGVNEILSIAADEVKWPGVAFEGDERAVGTQQSVSNSVSQMMELPTGARFIRPLDVYERIMTDIHVIRQRITGKVMRIVTPDDPITQEEKLFMVNDISRLNPQLLQSLGLDQTFAPFFLLEEAEVPTWRIKFHRSVSGKTVVKGSERVLPISDYPIIPVVDEDTDNVEPRGEVDFQYGSQKLMNAAMSLVMLNAAGSSNKKTAVDATRAGISQDFDEFRTEWGLPNAVVDMNIDPNSGDFPIKEYGPDSLNPAFFTLVQFFAQDLQFATSTHSIRTGDPSQAPETFSALQTLGKWADDTLRIRRTRHELALERLFNIILEWSPHYYKFHKYFEVTNEETNQQETFQINAPFFNEFTKSWELMNDITGIQAHYRIRMGSTTESENLAESQLLLNLVNLNPAISKHIIARLPMFKPHEKQSILSDMDAVQQLSSQNQQLQQTINTMQGELQRRAQNINAMAKKLEIQNFKLKLEKNANKEEQRDVQTS